MTPRENSVLELDAASKRIKLLHYKVSEYRVEEAWKRFEEAGFKPLLIKGWAAAQFYANPSDRQFSDVDLAFAANEYESAKTLLKSLQVDITIDLHNEVKNLDTVDFQTLYKNSQMINCGSSSIRVLRPEDHLRVLCVHWLIDGGSKRDKLWDIYYLVKNRPIDFDWDECLKVVSFERQRWIICTIALAHKYLDLDLTDTPIAGSVGNIPKWFINAVEKEWKSDTFLIPMHLVTNDRKGFIKQLKKRIPPNPIQATVEMEGSFDKYPRLFYQTTNIIYRLFPFLNRVLKSSKR